MQDTSSAHYLDRRGIRPILHTVYRHPSEASSDGETPVGHCSARQLSARYPTGYRPDRPRKRPPQSSTRRAESPSNQSPSQGSVVLTDALEPSPRCGKLRTAALRVGASANSARLRVRKQPNPPPSPVFNHPSPLIISTFSFSPLPFGLPAGLPTPHSGITRTLRGFFFSI